MPKSIAIIRTAPLLLARSIASGDGELFLSHQPIAVLLFGSGCSVRLVGGYINGLVVPQCIHRLSLDWYIYIYLMLKVLKVGSQTVLRYWLYYRVSTCFLVASYSISHHRIRDHIWSLYLTPETLHVLKYTRVIS